jgi:hypothetical protein
VTFEPGIGKIYINGLPVTPVSHVASPTLPTFIAANNTTIPFSIGSYRGNLAYFFGGKLNLPLFYQRTLTASEVLCNYNATRRVYIP